MKTMFTRSFAILLLLTTLIWSCAKEDLNTPDYEPFGNVAAAAYSSEIPQTYMGHMLKMVKESPGWTPPVAARAFGYTGLALYESVQPGIPNKLSMAGQLNELGALPLIEENKDYHWGICANEAMFTILSLLMDNVSSENSTTLQNIHTDFENSFDNVSPAVLERSMTFGKAVAEAVFEYSKTDGGHQAHLNNFPADYIPVTGESAWVPTPPAFAPALQPYWGNVRPFVASSVEQAIAVPPYAYSTDPSSIMYKQAMEVAELVNAAEPEHVAIALFWADDPGATFTPPGHAVAIAKQVIDQEGEDLGKAAYVYAKLGLSLHDAFVTCWHNKYIYNLVRPVTYIIDHIDPTFTTIVGTPPFPEYTSRHSTNMGAFATVMESIYGKHYIFTDDSHAGVHPARSFNSFKEASNEAAISRIYGGIHYRQACVQGVILGEICGKNINKLNWNN
jgi:hypothetical protein